MKDDRIYLQHILDNLRKIEVSLLGFDKDMFLNVVDTQDAIFVGSKLSARRPSELVLNCGHVFPPSRGAPLRGDAR